MTRSTLLVKTGWTGAMLALLGLGACNSFAQENGPPKPSSNPANHAIFPEKGQTPEQMEKDQAVAYTWATEKTGWDPYKAREELAKAGVAVESGESIGGKVVKGAAGGALVGLAAGAIADDAGKGAAIGATAGGLVQGLRGRQSKKAEKTKAEEAQETYREKFLIWDRHFTAAMEGKGYVVK